MDLHAGNVTVSVYFHEDFLLDNRLLSWRNLQHFFYEYISTCVQKVQYILFEIRCLLISYFDELLERAR